MLELVYALFSLLRASILLLLPSYINTLYQKVRDVLLQLQRCTFPELHYLHLINTLLTWAAFKYDLLSGRKRLS